MRPCALTCLSCAGSDPGVVLTLMLSSRWEEAMLVLHEPCLFGLRGVLISMLSKEGNRPIQK